MKIVLINGIGLAGKDTFVKLVQLAAKKDGAFVGMISPIDPIKDFYTRLGWDGKKTPEARKNLNTLKHMWIETSNGPSEWVSKMISHHSGAGTKVLFIMVREFKEMMDMKKIAKSFSMPCITLNVVRKGLPISPVEQSFLDSIPFGYKFDVVIPNKTVSDFPNVPELEGMAEKFWDTAKGAKLNRFFAKPNLYCELAERIQSSNGKVLPESNTVSIYFQELCAILESKLEK